MWFVNRFWELLGAVGIPAAHYASHSFRIGAATTAALAGVPDSTIQMLGKQPSCSIFGLQRNSWQRVSPASHAET